MAGSVFGIDLGTTYSCISHIDAYGRPEVIRNMDGDPTTPSVVLFAGNDVVVGKQAKRQARIEPDSVAALVKRRMGDADWRFATPEREWSAAGVSSLVLGALARDAERATGEKVEDVVITVPAYFGDEERKATKTAGEIAGLNVLELVNEPTAAAYAYGFAQEGAGDETVLVYDLGGGTFDVTIIALQRQAILVVATDGDHELGGADWDARLAELLAEGFLAQNPGASDPLDDVYSEQELITTAEEAKQALSQRESYTALVVHEGRRASVTVTRAELEATTRSLFERTMELTRRAVAEARARGIASLDRVLLVGGSSKMPVVARRLQEELGVAPQLTDPDLAVAKGAALYGQKKQLERDVHATLVGQGILQPGQALDDAGGVDLTKATRDVAAAHGLTTDAAETIVRTRVQNVCSRGFGVLALRDGVDSAAFLTHRNDPLPLTAEETFYTVDDDQTDIRVRVFEQGGADESERPEDNRVIVQGEITDLPPGYPRGTAVTVRFEMANDGMLVVTAHHEAAHRPLRLEVDTGAALSPEQVAAERDAVTLLKRNL